MLNIEIKVKINDPDILKKRALSLAPFSGILKQKDTYFLLGNRRLKTREGSQQLEFIYYKRANNMGSKNSRYFIYRPNKIFFLVIKGILGIFLGEKKIVEKERFLYLYKNTRIHIDSVKNIGTFLELETVVMDKAKYGELKKEHEEVFAKLQLESMEKIPESYSDL